VQAVEAKTTELDSAIAEGRTAVEGALSGLIDKMSHALEEVRTELGQARANVESEMSQLEGQIGGALGELSSGKGHLIEELQRRVADEVRQRLDAAVGSMVEAIGELGTGIAAAQEACRTDREQTEPEVEALRDRFPLLQTGVTSVQQACRECGADWPA
jgi:uncharacterized phage infection (PIP) family protein YhgE